MSGQGENGVLARIARIAARYPDAPAYRNGAETLSYGALWEGAGRLAAYLEKVCGNDRSPVAVYGHKSGWMPLCFLACARTGRPYLPLDTGCPPARVRSILADAGVKTTLSAAQCAPEGFLDVSALPPEELLDDRCLWGEDGGVFYIIYTSGSEGAPKGVNITAGGLAAFTDWAAGLSGDGAGGVWLNQAPYSFDLSVMALYPALVSGGCVYDLDAETEFSALFAGLGDSGARVWVSTPSFAALCLADPSFCAALLPELRVFLFCGETLAPKLAARLFARFDARVVNTYGPTEATVAVTAAELTPALCGAPLPVGYARPGTKITVVDGSLRPLPDGAAGQVVIAGNCVCAGYIGGAHPEKFGLSDGLPAYYTGDLGHLERGALYLHGRLDAQLKYRGYRIEPAEIETALLSLGGVAQAAVLPLTDGGAVRGLTAFLAGESKKSALEIRRALRAILPAYMIPKRIVFLDALPLTASGKLDRNRMKGWL